MLGAVTTFMEEGEVSKNETFNNCILSAEKLHETEVRRWELSLRR